MCAFVRLYVCVCMCVCLCVCVREHKRFAWQTIVLDQWCVQKENSICDDNSGNLLNRLTIIMNYVFVAFEELRSDHCWFRLVCCVCPLSVFVLSRLLFQNWNGSLCRVFRRIKGKANRKKATVSEIFETIWWKSPALKPLQNVYCVQHLSSLAQSFFGNVAANIFAFSFIHPIFTPRRSGRPGTPRSSLTTNTHTHTHTHNENHQRLGWLLQSSQK